MRRLEHFSRSDGVINLRAMAGSEISACIKEACILALEENSNVSFEHNGTTVTIVPNDIVNNFYQKWAKDREQ